MSIDWDASVYDDIEREARADAAWYGMDEDDNHPDPSEWYEDDDLPRTCPVCGNTSLTYEGPEPDVGLFGIALFCEAEFCGWDWAEH